MDKEIYLIKFKYAIKEKGYKETYTNKCLEYVERLCNKQVPIIFDIRHFSLLIGISISNLTSFIFAEDNFYTTKEILKKSGGKRVLHIPSLDLKYIQRWILDNILKNMNVSEYAIGFCDNRSILNNAQLHVGKECVLNMDIKDFFPSITFEMIYNIFFYYGYTKEVSFMLAKLCTYQNQLPQGSPASPYLSNLVCKKLDTRLSALAKSYEATYSRYADDITFSGRIGISKLEIITKKILEEEAFTMNNKKTRIAYKYQRQEVTGLIVNGNNVRVSKKYKRALYQEIYYCIKFGVQDHMKKINCDKLFYKEHLFGKAYFVNMIEKEEGKKIFKLLENVEWDY